MEYYNTILMCKAVFALGLIGLSGIIFLAICYAIELNRKNEENDFLPVTIKK